MYEYFVQDFNFSTNVTSEDFACKTVSTDFNSTQVDCGFSMMLCMLLSARLICCVVIG